MREADEELGIPGIELKFVHKFPPSKKSINEFIALYTVTSDMAQGHARIQSVSIFLP